MKLFRFEAKKLIRSTGFRYLCAAVLILNFLFCLLGDLYSPETDEYITKYEENIGYVIRVAERNLLEYEALSDAEHYMTRYQREVIGHYSELLLSGVRPEKTEGWNEFFDNNDDDLLMLFAAVVAGVLISMSEFDNGTEKLLHMTVRGRRSVMAKTAVLALFSPVICILLILSSLAGIALRFGLTSPFVPLCSVEAFIYCPYAISVIGYLAISLAIKSLNLFGISLFAAICAVLTRSYLASIAIALGSVGAGYLISAGASANAAKLLNTYSVALTAPIFERYRSLDLFDRSISLTAVLLIVLIIACALSAVLFNVLFLKSFASSRAAGIEKALLGLLGKAKDNIVSGLPRIKPRRRSLLFSEAKKSFAKSRLLILCAVMICIKLSFCYANDIGRDPAEAYYRERCYELSGELTEEKRTLISEKLAECREVLSRFDSMRNAAVSGLITSEEYQAYLDEHSIASAEQFVYSKLSLQCARIDAAADKGIGAKIIYDTGWIAIFERGADIMLYLFLLLFFCGIYENEYKTGFYRIASVSASGMKALHRSKLILAAIVSALAFLLFALTDILFLANALPLPNPDYSLASVLETSLSIPIWCAMIAKYAVECAVAVLFSFAVCLLSRFLKKTYLVIPAGLLIALFIIL